VKRQTYTAKGRLRTSPMPFLYGKEWASVKSIVQSLVLNNQYLAGIDASLKDLVELEKQKLGIQSLK